MSKSIIVPIDGSKRSIDALKFALSIAKGCGDQLVLLNVHSSSQIIGEHLLEESVSIVEQENIPYKTKVRVGNPTIEISSEARDSNVRCIIMGYRGAGNDSAGNKILGSVSNGILQLSPCPVTLVPDKQ